MAELRAKGVWSRMALKFAALGKLTHRSADDEATSDELTLSERQLLLSSFRRGVGARTVISDDHVQVVADKLAGTPHATTL